MIHLPPSKSIGARFLVATYFAGTLPADPFFEENEDLMLLQQALLEIYSDEEPIDYGDSPIDVGASGTALRFVTAVCASSPGADYVITGTTRLLQRPMLPLVNLLKDAGAVIDILGENSTGPYRVKGNKLKGGDFSIEGNISSQFISSLMLVAPYWEKGMKLDFISNPVSRPYIEMTAKIMSEFGIKVELNNDSVEVKSGQYIEPVGFKVEADWSAASFFYEACALGVESISIPDLVAPDKSLQGDAVAASIFDKLGVVSSFSKDSVRLKRAKNPVEKLIQSFNDCPDLMLPLGVTCLCLGIRFRFEDISHLRLKESDRIKSFCDEAFKLGFSLKTGDNYIEWNGETNERQADAVIDSHEDHRVAMAFAMTALIFGEIKIKNPEVVEKSYIDFWNQLPEIGLVCRQEGDIMKISK